MTTSKELKPGEGMLLPKGWDIAEPSTLVEHIEWIPITERLPTEEGNRYLVASPGTVFLATWNSGRWIDTAVYRGGDGQPRRYVLGGIAYWSELPKLPVSKQCKRKNQNED